MIVLFVQPDLRCAARSFRTLDSTCRVVPPYHLQTPFIVYALELTSGFPSKPRCSRRVGLLATHGPR